MKHSRTKSQKFDYLKTLHIVFFAAMMISVMLHNSVAHAAPLVSADYRVAAAADNFSGTVHFATAFKLRPPRRFGVAHTELAIGTIATSDDSRLFVSLGPVWQVPLSYDSTVLEFGISPTFIGGSSFNNREMGGKFHFTSFASVGTNFGKRNALRLSLRIQHTSNGGLNSTNPGMDMIGFNVSFNPNSQGEHYENF